MVTKSTSMKLTLKVTSFIVRTLLNIVFYTLVVLLIINVSKKAFEFTYQIYGPVTVDEAPGRDIIFQISKGESKMDIAKKYSFFLKTKLQEDVIIPGTYVINSSMTYDKLLAVITDYSNSIVREEDTKAPENDPASDMDDNTDSDTGADAANKDPS